MEEQIEIRFNDNTVKHYPKGTTYEEISLERTHLFESDILAAKVDNNVVELWKKAKTGKVEFIDLATKSGQYMYEKALSFMFISATKEILDKDASVRIENSIDKGIYVEIDNDTITEKKIKRLEDKMRELVKEEIPFRKISVLRLDAIKYFKKIKRFDKVKNLQYMASSYVSLYKFNSEYDYFYSKFPKSSKVINKFKLNYLHDHGLIISFPRINNPLEINEYVHHPLIAEKFNEYTYWGSLIGVANSADLNEIIASGKIGDLIRISESLSNNSLVEIADKIYNKKDKIKIVLIAGPSSSGKTTASKKLAMHLKTKGLKPYQISLDDYFKDRVNTPKDEKDEYEYESIKAIDLELFNKHLDDLLNGKEVLLPEYNFIKGEKEYINKKLQIKDNGIIIIEGLHGLNEELTKIVPRKNKYKVYVSPLTQLNIDNHNYVHTTDVRLLRRIIRDNRYRGYSTSKILEMWKKVREGEEINIFPYQDDADIIYNTALSYEIGVLKTYVEPLLYSVTEEDPNYTENKRLIKFLNNFLPIPSDEIPKDSIIREFIGGSCFRK